MKKFKVECKCGKTGFVGEAEALYCTTCRANFTLTPDQTPRAEVTCSREIPTVAYPPDGSYGSFSIHEEVYYKDGWFRGLLILKKSAFQASAGPGSNNKWYQVGADPTFTFKLNDQLVYLRRLAADYGYKRVR